MSYATDVLGIVHDGNITHSWLVKADGYSLSRRIVWFAPELCSVKEIGGREIISESDDSRLLSS